LTDAPPAGEDTPRPPAHSRSRLRDPRVWLGLAITAAALWLALRGVDFRAVIAEFRNARWGLLLGISVPAYVAVVWLRALRWRHLTDAIQPMPASALFRAVAVGFMANNLFPLRMGEFVRSWYLARETGTSAAAVLGTVILERVIDTLCVIGLALGVVFLFGGETGAWQRGVLWLAPVALLPLGLLVALRAAPERALGLAAAVLRPAPARVSGWILEQLRGFAAGLGALRGGSHLAWIGLHSLTIWLVASTLPMLAGFWALDVELGPPTRTLAVGWMTLAAIGIAVALPSAPGFFGVYHSACRLVLERFGISPEMAVALGTRFHAVFWLTTTGLGALVLRSRHTSLGEIDRLTQR